MRMNSYYKFFSIFLILLSISSFFIGFIYGENSAGAGGFNGDFNNTWGNLQLFLNNDISTALRITANADQEIFVSARTPLIYILHKLFNPFVKNEIIFIRSVFFISLLLPFLFYLCLREKFKEKENLLLILISSIVLLSPYFRTSSFWAGEENFGLISLLISFIFLNQFLSNNKNILKDYYRLFLIVFFSSITLYFDQKLAIIPLICFFKIIFSNKSPKLKFFSIFLYFIFSLPYIYLITLWGNLIPTRDAMYRGVANQFFLDNLGYLSTIIAFYLLPLLLYKGENLIKLFKNFFLEKKSYYLISLFFIYLLYLLIFHDYTREVYPGYNTMLGRGFIHKIAILLFEENYIQKLFIYFSFFVSWMVILIYVNDNFKDKLIISYFFLLSIIVWPFFQEYLDPLIILMAFTFFNSKLFINYKNSILLFFYLSILLIFSNIYYYNLLS